MHVITENESTQPGAATPDNRRAELGRILQSRLLSPHFQPIVELRGRRIIGYEALIRGPADSPLHTPDALFEAAAGAGMLGAVEFAAREASCEGFAALGLAGNLFLNASPLSFLDKHYNNGVTLALLQRVGLSAERVVFELTENQPLENLDLLRSTSAQLKRQGFAIALDDLGAGYAGLRVWSALHPNYVKIDRHFMAGIDADPVKREFVRAMLDIAHRLGNAVIAEGIETGAELETVLALGVELVQGFFIARPAANPVVAVPRHLSDFQSLRHPQHFDYFRRVVRDITIHVEPIPVSSTGWQALKRFRTDLRIGSLPVVDGTQPIGMVSRTELLNVFSRPYSFELFGKKPVTDFISPHTVIVGIDEPLHAAGRRITEDPQHDPGVDFVVSDGGDYCGVGRVLQLLRCITDDKLRAARHSNPLTQLPGNVPLYEWVDHLLQQKASMVVVYCDINQFKPFNDAYGYRFGDEVIAQLAGTICRHVDAGRDFVGHVGGDDFIIVFRSTDWRERCRRILDDFSQVHQSLVPAQDTDYWSRDRSGQRKRFGKLSLSMGSISPDVDAVTSHHQISLLLAEAKHSAKSIGGNVLFESRRRSIPPGD